MKCLECDKEIEILVFVDGVVIVSIKIMSGTEASERTNWGGGKCSFAEPTGFCCTIRPQLSCLKMKKSKKSNIIITNTSVLKYYLTLDGIYI